MKKIIAILLAVMLVASMAVPAYAVTPALKIPDMPEIPDLSDDVKIELPEGSFDDYIPDSTEKPTEPPADIPNCPNWCDFVIGWVEWWKTTLKNYYG